MVTLDRQKYAPMLPNDKGGTVTISIETMFTIASFILDLHTFEVPLSVYVSIKGFLFTSQIMLDVLALKSFLAHRCTKLCCVLKFERQFYSILSVPYRHGRRCSVL